jgi:hypothetical protein
MLQNQLWDRQMQQWDYERQVWRTRNFSRRLYCIYLHWTPRHDACFTQHGDPQMGCASHSTCPGTVTVAVPFQKQAPRRQLGLQHAVQN